MARLMLSCSRSLFKMLCFVTAATTVARAQVTMAFVAASAEIDATRATAEHSAWASFGKALLVRETGLSRLAEDPHSCGRHIFLGRFCHGVSSNRAPRGFYDECNVVLPSSGRKMKRPFSTSFDHECPLMTHCSVAPVVGAPWPLIVCLAPALVAGGPSLSVTDRLPASRTRRNRFDMQAIHRLTFSPSRANPGVGSVVVDPAALQPAPATARGAPSLAPGWQHYTTDISVGAGLSDSLFNVIGLPVPLERRGGPDWQQDEPPAQRQRTVGDYTVTRNADPAPLCTATEASDICAPTSSTPLEEGDVLHLDLIAAESMNSVLELIVIDLDAFTHSGTKPPP